MLPKEVSLTYRANDKLSYVAELSAEGSSYLITRATLDGYDALEYRRSQVGLSFGIEKLISDVAGVSLSAGVAQPLNAVLVETGSRTRDRLWTFYQNMKRACFAGCFCWLKIFSPLARLPTCMENSWNIQGKSIAVAAD